MATVPLQPASSAAPLTARMLDEEFDLQSLLCSLLDGKWLIISSMLACLGLGSVYALVAQPIFRADALLQVEKKQSGSSRIDDITSLLTGEAQADAEIEIIRSRSVIGATVDALQLDIIAKPRYFPLVGRAIARRFAGQEDEIAEPLFGLSSFAWGGEEIQVDHLHVPRAWRDQPLKLIAESDTAYQLLAPTGETLLNGEVGKKMVVRSLPGTGVSGKKLEIRVTDLWARPGTEFIVTKRSRPELIAAMQESLTITEKGKQTGVIGISLMDPSPERVTDIVNNLADIYLQQNVRRKSEDSEKMLDFLNGQLPKINSDLDAAETALNEHMQRTGNVDRTADLSLTAQSLIDLSKDVEAKIAEFEMQRSELRQRFTEQHPTLIALQQKLTRLRNDRTAIEQRMKNLPSTEIESARRMRDVEVNKEIYIQLVNKTQELGVAKAGAIGNVRVLDRAIVPDKPVKPKPVLIVGVSTVLGLAMGVFVTLLRRALQKGIDDPETVEQQLGLAVMAVIPHSDSQRRLFRRGKLRDSSHHKVLALSNPNDLAIESLRSLRTGLQMTLLEASNQVITVTGPAPSIGKSFVSVNLAHVLADTGKRVLLIDGDIRKGYLNDYFDQSRAPGLADILGGATELDEAIRAIRPDNLDFLPTGTIPTNPAELLASERFRLLFQRLTKTYDLVLFDTPPVMAVTDAAVIGRLAGVNLLVLKAGKHPTREISACLRRFQQGGAKIHGAIFNDMVRRQGAFGHGKYSYYQYEYK